MQAEAAFIPPTQRSAVAPAHIQPKSTIVEDKGPDELKNIVNPQDLVTAVRAVADACGKKSLVRYRKRIKSNLAVVRSAVKRDPQLIQSQSFSLLLNIPKEPKLLNENLGEAPFSIAQKILETATFFVQQKPMIIFEHPILKEMLREITLTTGSVCGEPNFMSSPEQKASFCHLREVFVRNYFQR